MIILGLDPGSANFGYSVVQRGKRMCILEFGQIDDTVKNLTAKSQKPPKSRKKDGPIPPLKDGMFRFLSVIEVLFNQYPIEELNAERFQTRGIKGKSTELVSFMLGMLGLYCRQKNIKFNVTIAGTWKNRVNRCWPLDDLYVFGKELGLSPHEIDAILIGMTRGGRVNPPSLENMKTLLKMVVAKQSTT